MKPKITGCPLEPPTALFVSTQHWQSCFQLGSHHIARCFAERGWRVGFISAPVSPAHLAGLGGDTVERIASWRGGGAIDEESGIWHYVPFAPLPWGAGPLFRQRQFVKLAWSLCRPALTATLRNAGFHRPHLACTDHFLHEGLVQAAEPRLTVFRRADSLAGFPGAGADFAKRELEFAKRADITLCTTPDSAAYFGGHGIDNTVTVPNGIRLDRFLGNQPLPDEYRDERRPIVVYVGAAEQWLDVDLIVRGVTELKHLCWTIIGPFGGDAGERLRQAGANVLGRRPHEALAAYLRHAHIGIVPFSLTHFGELIRHVSPLKVFEYSASGLPVVGTTGCQYPAWLPTPMAVCDTAEKFLAAVGEFASQPKPVRPGSEQFTAFDWPARLIPLFDWLEQADTPAITEATARAT